MGTLGERVDRERESYGQGRVFESSRALQSRFFHVMESPNSKYGRLQFTKLLEENCISATVLEIGCLQSPHYDLVQKAFPTRYIGIDICEKAISDMRRTHPKGEFYVMDAHKLEFDFKFDVIFGMSILHHLEFETALAIFKKHLAPGGVIPITTQKCI